MFAQVLTILASIFFTAASILAAEGKVVQFHPLKDQNIEISHADIKANRLYLARSPVTGKQSLLLSRALNSPLTGSEWFRVRFASSVDPKTILNEPSPKSADAILEWFALSAGTAVPGSFFGLNGSEAATMFMFKQSFTEDPNTHAKRLDGWWVEMSDQTSPTVIRTADTFEDMNESSGRLAWELNQQSGQWQILAARSEKGSRVIQPRAAFKPGVHELFDPSLGKNGELLWAYLFEKSNLYDGGAWPLAVGSVVPNVYVDAKSTQPAKLSRLSMVKNAAGFSYAKWVDGGQLPFKMVHSLRNEALVYSPTADKAEWKSVELSSPSRYNTASYTSAATERSNADQGYILPFMGQGQTQSMPFQSTGSTQGDLEALQRRVIEVERILSTYPGGQPLPLGYRP